MCLVSGHGNVRVFLRPCHHSAWPVPSHLPPTQNSDLVTTKDTHDGRSSMGAVSGVCLATALHLQVSGDRCWRRCVWLLGSVRTRVDTSSVYHLHHIRHLCGSFHVVEHGLREDLSGGVAQHGKQGLILQMAQKANGEHISGEPHTTRMMYIKLCYMILSHKICSYIWIIIIILKLSIIKNSFFCCTKTNIDSR